MRACSSRSMSASGARTQPRRSPPQNDLLALPIVIASRAWAASGRGMASASPGASASAWWASSATTVVRVRASAWASSSRWLSLIRCPVGFWKSGIR